MKVSKVMPLQARRVHGENPEKCVTPRPVQRRARLIVEFKRGWRGFAKEWTKEHKSELLFHLLDDPSCMDLSLRGHFGGWGSARQILAAPYHNACWRLPGGVMNAAGQARTRWATGPQLRSCLLHGTLGLNAAEMLDYLACMFDYMPAPPVEASALWLGKVGPGAAATIAMGRLISLREAFRGVQHLERPRD